MDRLGPTDAPGVRRDDDAALTEDDLFGIGMGLDGPPDHRRNHRIFVVLEPHPSGL